MLLIVSHGTILPSADTLHLSTAIKLYMHIQHIYSCGDTIHSVFSVATYMGHTLCSLESFISSKVSVNNLNLVKSINYIYIINVSVSLFLYKLNRDISMVDHRHSMVITSYICINVIQLCRNHFSSEIYIIQQLSVRTHVWCAHSLAAKRSRAAGCTVQLVSCTVTHIIDTVHDFDTHKKPQKQYRHTKNTVNKGMAFTHTHTHTHIHTHTHFVDDINFQKPRARQPQASVRLV